MTTAATNVFLGRNDTMLGVCEAIGNDFGFNPLWLRLAFALPMAFVPMWSIGAYLLLGAVVMLARLIVRSAKARPGEVVQLPASAEREETVEANRALALAA